MRSLGSILDGYVMVFSLYLSNNLLLIHPLRKQLRIPWWSILPLTVIEAVAVYQSLHLFWTGNIVVMFLFLMLFKKAIDIETYKLMYIHMVTVAYTTTCNLLFFMMWGHAYTWMWRETCLMILVYAFTAPIVAIWMNKLLWPRLSRLKLPTSRWLWILPALVITIAMLIGSAHVQQLFAGYDILYGAIAILLTVSLSVVGLMLLAYMDKIQTVANHRNALHILDMQIADQTRRYSAMVGYMDEIRVVRHDMRHHVRVASMLLDNGKLNELRDYLAQMDCGNQSHDNIIYSSNYISDLVAHHTLNVAKDADIHVSIQCGLPKYFWVSDTDLCVLLGNLMENALNACRMQEDREKEIVFTAEIHGSEAFIRVENTCCDASRDTPERRKVLGLPQSGGYGMLSIHTIATKYQGMTVFDRKGNHFTASVLLNKPKDEVINATRPQVENKVLNAV